MKNPVEITEDNAVRLQLGGGGHVVIDLQDLPRIAGYRWSRDGHGYARTAIRVGGKQVMVRLHRLLMAADGQASEGQVDHRDGDRANCQRANLRLCTHAQNVRNRAANAANATGFKGVRQHKSGSYFVQIKTNGQQFRVGKFDTPEEAARGYDFLARRLFGQWARLNFPVDE